MSFYCYKPVFRRFTANKESKLGCYSQQVSIIPSREVTKLAHLSQILATGKIIQRRSRGSKQIPSWEMPHQSVIVMSRQRARSFSEVHHPKAVLRTVVHLFPACYALLLGATTYLITSGLSTQAYHQARQSRLVLRFLL